MSSNQALGIRRRLGLEDITGDAIALTERIGGDEFLVFVRQTRRLDLETRLNKLLQDVHFTCKSDEGEEIQLSVSIGCVICEHESMTCDEMTEAADKLMYDAKSAGRDRLFIRTV